MALQADTHKARVEARVAEQLPRLDPVALDELGMTQAEAEELERSLRGSIVLPGMPDYPAAADLPSSRVCADGATVRRS